VDADWKSVRTDSREAELLGRRPRLPDLRFADSSSWPSSGEVAGEEDVPPLGDDENADLKDDAESGGESNGPEVRSEKREARVSIGSSWSLDRKRGKELKRDSFSC